MHSPFRNLCRRLAGLRDDRGATAVEYALMVALIAGVIAGVVAVLGSTLYDIFNNMIGKF